MGTWGLGIYDIVSSYVDRKMSDIQVVPGHLPTYWGAMSAVEFQGLQHPSPGFSCSGQAQVLLTSRYLFVLKKQ